VGWGPSPPPCGQLTRCFSAVTELLVFLPVGATRCKYAMATVLNLIPMEFDGIVKHASIGRDGFVI